MGLNPDFRFVAIIQNNSEFKIIERKDTGYEIVVNVSHAHGRELIINVLDEEPLSYLFTSPNNDTLLTRLGSDNYTYDINFPDYANTFRDRDTFLAVQIAGPLRQFVDCGPNDKSSLNADGFC